MEFPSIVCLYSKHDFKMMIFSHAQPPPHITPALGNFSVWRWKSFSSIYLHISITRVCYPTMAAQQSLRSLLPHFLHKLFFARTANNTRKVECFTKQFLMLSLGLVRNGKYFAELFCRSYWKAFALLVQMCHWWRKQVKRSDRGKFVGSCWIKEKRNPFGSTTASF